MSDLVYRGPRTPDFGLDMEGQKPNQYWTAWSFSLGRQTGALGPGEAAPEASASSWSPAAAETHPEPPGPAGRRLPWLPTPWQAGRTQARPPRPEPLCWPA